MAKTLNQIRQTCADLSIEEIEKRIFDLNKAHRSKDVANLYQTVLDELKPKEDNKPLDLIIGEYWVHLRTSAHRRNKDFNLTFSDVKKLALKKKCAYTGKEFTGIKNRTIDRLDPNKGYVRGNVFAVSEEANLSKNMLLECDSSKMRMTLIELKAMINKLDELGFE